MAQATLGTRAAKNELHDAFAQVGKALANGHRIELLDLLAQGERSVEVLASRAEISVALASAHLQALRRAGLVMARRDGNRILHRLADDDVYALLVSLRTVASRLGDAERAAARFLGSPQEAVSREELLGRVRSGDAVVVDLRPTEEFEAGHIAGALSVPLPELEARLAELPADVEIVAYCRGPYCAMSPQAVALLERAGRRARRLEDGYPEWRLAGLPVETGAMRAGPLTG
jgi:rhodanese-related sulfurtransferase/DNA-binding transcriptional ArsR family regulator